MTETKSVLAVDDNPVNLDVISELLSEKFTVSTASSGSKALELFQITKPDIIILDVMMPDLDGFQTCQRIRQLPNGNTVKIVMLSGKDYKSDVERAINAGADDYLTKPFTKQALLYTLEKLLH